MSISGPFKYEDMDDVPESWHIHPPDFVGVASGKSGTSWWFKLLIEHPSVKPNRLNRKELIYFNHYGYNGIDSADIETYRNAFASPSGCICGEWSPGYLNHPLAINYLARAVPETRILAIVRNPIDRTLSALNQQLATRCKILDLEGLHLYIFKTFSIYPNIFFNSLYYRPFKNLLKFFKPSQILVLQYEQCKLSPENEIKKTYRFLNIDDQFIPKELVESVNKIPYSIPLLSEHARCRMAEYFYDDVLSLQKLFPEIDISLWKDFNK